MIYVTSDLHGCHPGDFQRFLTKADFGDDDFLFILGDVIDRGEYGAELLLWLTEQPNMQLILGNHEALLLACSFLFEEVTEESLEALNCEQLRLMEGWLKNGASPTIAGFRKLLRRDPELVAGILDYLQDAPLYETLTVNERNYILVHAGLDNFHPARPLNKYTPDELTWVRPNLDTRYFENSTVILGHTPTEYYGMDYRGRALHTDTWIDIDTGATMGHNPMLLRLDDMMEFYM